MTSALDDLIKPELKHKWNTEIRPRWFVQNPDDPDESREPGLMKIEQHITKGSCVALRKALMNIAFNIIEYESLIHI